MVHSHDTVNRELSAVGALAGARLHELRDEIWDLLTNDIAELRGDDIIERLLDASVEENITTLSHVFEHGIPLDAVEVPAAANEYAKRLAQRGVPIVALIRAYRIGHGRFLVRCVEELAKRPLDVGLTADVTARLVEVSFRYIDRITEELVRIYQQERDGWLLTHTAGRAARVRALLANELDDLDAAESALGYRLRQQHLGVVAWVADGADRGDGLARLDRLTKSAAKAVGNHGRALFVPRDESIAWAWLPLGTAGTTSSDHLAAAFSDDDQSARVAIGEAAYGLDGFRQTHQQAIRTQHLALAARPGTRVTAFADVGTIALICDDLAAARRWVGATLGDLAIDDQPHKRLRETLETFLSTGSYTVTATRMMLHKNGVQYRIRRAREALPAPIEGRRADLELALRACRYLGRAVLRSAVDQPPPVGRPSTTAPSSPGAQGELAEK